jgi:hypothetical protein
VLEAKHRRRIFMSDGARLAQRRKKAPAVGIVAKNRLAPVSTIQNMVNRACKFHACFSSH